MTNMIQFPSRQSDATSDTSFVTKQSYSIADSSFDTLFSTLISEINSNSIFDEDGSSSTSLMEPIQMLMFNKLFGYENSPDTSIDSVPQGSPVNGVLTQGSHEGHVALDFGVPIGTSITSTMKGKVTYAGWNNEGYGNLVIIENGAYKTYYAHLSSIPVNVGQNVSEGDVIGVSGNSGNSTGPHLHYEVRKNGVVINPLITKNEKK